MKTTVRQKEICELIIRQAKSWCDTNDISSHSHYTYIMEEIQKEDLNKDQETMLYDRLADLFYFIKNML